ncbi:hypothetical protein ACF3NT_03810 [Naumannella halotolerans]|uniref:hypothetical protein n=1 Tax=Naumannella halotolerans TaxID=993414 RepID=UPI00370D3707
MSESLSPRLAEQGVQALIGTVWNPNGLILAKSVPVRRADSFAGTGLGASPTWFGFTIDQGGIAEDASISAVGDNRIRIDADAVRVLPGGLAWAPAGFYDQNGDPVPQCGRGTLQRVVAELAENGLSAKVGHELEFQLFAADGSPLPRQGWAPYSLSGMLAHEDFLHALYAEADAVGLPIEQVHPEFAMRQFEFSLAPADPVSAADTVVLARLVVQRVAHQCGYSVSFSPKPYAAEAGNGAHQHFSLTRDGVPLFSGGNEVRGLTAQGASAIGRVVELLGPLQAVIAGSVLSTVRMTPNSWAGAHAGWGLENREVAVRLIGATAANPSGANVEVKIIDPASSAYIASAAVLATMLDGILSGTSLVAEADRDPNQMSPEERRAAGIAVLSNDQNAALDALDASTDLRRLLGDVLVDVIVAGRRHEAALYGDWEVERLAERFRFAWGF